MTRCPECESDLELDGYDLDVGETMNCPECSAELEQLLAREGLEPADAPAQALHQFAQPDIDWRNPEQDGRVLYLRPLLRE